MEFVRTPPPAGHAHPFAQALNDMEARGSDEGGGTAAAGAGAGAGAGEWSFGAGAARPPSTSSSSYDPLTGGSATPRHLHSPPHMRSVSASPSQMHSRRPSQQQLVLRGSELTAFTGALREMVRSNQLRAARQDKLNETNSQLHAMNFFLHYCNAERSLRAQREYESVRSSIEEGRSMLAHMSNVVAAQETALATLGSSLHAMEERAEETAGRVANVEEELVSQKAALASAMRDYEARLHAQECEMRKQEAVLARLLSVRFKIDFGLDVLMAMLAWYLAHNGLVRVMAHYVARNLLFARTVGKKTRARHSRTFVSLAQLALFLLLLRRVRSLALEKGLHHSIGSYSKYFQFATATIGTAVEAVRGGVGAGAVSLQDPADREELQQMQMHAHARAPSEALVDPDGEHVDGHDPTSGSLPPLLHPRAPSPDFTESQALSLGRTVGRVVLTGLRSGRDGVRWVLRRVVASSANPDMEVEGARAADTAAATAAAAAATPSTQHRRASASSRPLSPSHDGPQDPSHPYMSYAQVASHGAGHASPPSAFGAHTPGGLPHSPATTAPRSHFASPQQASTLFVPSAPLLPDA